VASPAAWGHVDVSSTSAGGVVGCCHGRDRVRSWPGIPLQRPEVLVAALGHWQWQVDALLGQQADLGAGARGRIDRKLLLVGWCHLP
jgi:hypothetical protein